MMMMMIIIIIIHFNICKETGIQLVKKHRYKHVPKSVETSQGGKVTVMWNQVQTDRNNPNNKPDIITRDNEKGTCMLIDVAISGDRNVIKIEVEKTLKYIDLTIEIQHTWNVRTKVIPVITGATRNISKSFTKYMSNIPGKHEVKELQKTAILGTSHIFRKVLM
jgi:enolase